MSHQSSGQNVLLQQRYLPILPAQKNAILPVASPSLQQTSLVKISALRLFCMLDLDLKDKEWTGKGKVFSTSLIFPSSIGPALNLYLYMKITMSRLIWRESTTSMTSPEILHRTSSSAAYISPLAAARSLFRETAAWGSTYWKPLPGLLPRSMPPFMLSPAGIERHIRLPFKPHDFSELNQSTVHGIDNPYLPDLTHIVEQDSEKGTALLTHDTEIY